MDRISELSEQQQACHPMRAEIRPVPDILRLSRSPAACHLSRVQRPSPGGTHGRSPRRRLQAASDRLAESDPTVSRDMFHATTVLAVRHRDQTVMASDGQVTFGDTVVKQTARKIRRLYNDRILAGFAGSAADSFALFSRFEAKLEQYRGNLERSAVELAKDWRTDRMLRRLEAMLIVMDAQVHVPPLGQRRSHRARRRDHRDRIGGRVRAGGGEGAGAAHRARRADRSPRQSMLIAAAHLHLHERQRSRSKAL